LFKHHLIFKAFFSWKSSAHVKHTKLSTVTKSTELYLGLVLRALF